MYHITRKKLEKNKRMNGDNIIVLVIRAPSHRNSASKNFLSPGDESVVRPQGNECHSAHKQQVVTTYREFGLDRHSQQPHLYTKQEQVDKNMNAGENSVLKNTHTASTENNTN